jgi:hypothetical protein
MLFARIRVSVYCKEKAKKHALLRICHSPDTNFEEISHSVHGFDKSSFRCSLGPQERLGI